MDNSEKTEEFYKKLKTQLQDTSLWPTTYLYKFIVKTEGDRVNQIKALFNHMGAVINTTQSKNAKYTSVSVNVKMKSPDAVIAKYKEVAAKVDGVISL